MSMTGAKTLMEGIGKGLGIAGKAVTDKDKLNEIKSDIIQAEINSDSSYLKNARPSVIYTGIIVILMEMLGLRLGMLSWTGATPEMVESSTAILTYFLIAWGGVVGTISVGRTVEKKNRNTLFQQKEAAIEIEKMKLEAEFARDEFEMKEEKLDNKAARKKDKRPLFGRNKTKP